MSQSKLEQTQGISNKRRNSLSLQTRLVLFTLLIALIPLIIIAIRDTLQTQQALTNGAEISLKSGAAQTANSLDNFIQNTLDSIAAESNLADLIYYIIIPPSSRDGIVVRDRTLALLNNLSQKDSLHIISYAIVDIKGNVLLDNSPAVKYNESGQYYFSQINLNNSPIVTPVTYSKDNPPTITFASKIVNNGEYIGILRVKYASTVLQDVILKSVGPSTDVSVLLLDPLNIRMADSQNPDLILKSIVPLDPEDYLIAVNTHRFLNISREEQATNYEEFASALYNAVDEPFFSADITPDIPGKDTIAVAFMKTQPWTVTYSRPTNIFLADAQKQTRANIILIGIASVIISIIAVFVARSLTNPITALAKVANSISQGDLKARASVNTEDEIGLLASSFNSMTDQLQSTLVGLEQRVNERTADLQKSTQELETIAIVAREVSIIRDMDTLLKVSAELIRERFKYYHVGIYIIEESGEFAILRAASGMAAIQLLGQNHKLKVGREGMVGNVTRTGQARIALDVGTDAVHFQSPLLPLTHSEIALPLRSRNMTIGALDIQAEIPSAFSEQDVKVLQLLADQLAAAIENAELVERVEKTYAELENAYHLQTQSIWKTAINQHEHPAYEYDGIRVRPVPPQLPRQLMQRLENGEPIFYHENNGQSGANGKTTLMVPLMVLNQVIGVIGLEQEDPNHDWTDEEIAIAQAAANRAGITLENARLLEESQRRATKEQTIFNATERIGSVLNIGNILQAAAEEIEKIVGSAEVTLQFNNDNASSTNEK